MCVASGFLLSCGNKMRHFQVGDLWKKRDANTRRLGPEGKGDPINPTSSHIESANRPEPVVTSREKSERTVECREGESERHLPPNLVYTTAIKCQSRGRIPFSGKPIPIGTGW